MKKTIGWIQISRRRYGGNIYGERVRKALESAFAIDQIIIRTGYVPWKYLNVVWWFLGFLQLKGTKDLWVVQSFLAVAALPLSRIKGKRLAVIYHLDNSVFPWIVRPIFFFLEAVFFHNLKKIDAIVTISEYWKNFFIQKGYSHVYKIYPAFDLEDFDISEQEIEDFKKRFGLGEKPIVYIGNCQKAKGVEESYETLKDLNVQLLTSGEKHIDIPALNLDLSHKDYLCLLKASSCVVTMSTFQEGWNMTAHEAMLVKTPVVGSGLGGMRELLEGGGQIVCEDFGQLKERVEHLVANPEEVIKFGERGYIYAKQFTNKRFQEQWLELTHEIGL